MLGFILMLKQYAKNNYRVLTLAGGSVEYLVVSFSLPEVTEVLLVARDNDLAVVREGRLDLRGDVQMPFVFTCQLPALKITRLCRNMRSQIGIDPFISIIRSSVDGTISFNILIF